MSVVQWVVANIRGNSIAGGDEFMEYVTPVAWRNCHKNRDNHGGVCSGEGLIYDPEYVQAGEGADKAGEGGEKYGLPDEPSVNSVR